MNTLSHFDIGGIELEYRISDNMFHQMREPLKKSGLAVVSIHNFFPFPAAIRGLKPGGDMFALSDTDRERRRLAIQWTIRTIEHANDLGAPFVVLHCGFVDMDPQIGVLQRFFQDQAIETDPARDFIRERRAELARKKPPHLESLLFSLDRLVRAAEKNSVTLGLENRYHYHELPGMEDFGLFFSEFSGGPLGYWHDTGHAHATEVLGLQSTGRLLELYGGHLAGMHLHDAQGLTDHLTPGSGEVDFERLKSFLRPGLPKVLELKPGTADTAVSEGLDFLRRNGFDAA